MGDREADTLVLGPFPQLDAGGGSELGRVLGEALERRPQRVVVDLSATREFDSFGVSALVRAVGESRAAGTELRLRRPSPELTRYLSLVDVARAPAPRRPPRETLVARIGFTALSYAGTLRAQAALSWLALHHVFVGPVHAHGVRWDRVALEIVRVGFNALPITLLIMMMMGAILALQSAVQLREFGATVFVARLVGISITREIAPLLVGMVLAGRSGSANTAEIGTMVVSEELDALRQMGIDPGRFLLVPKIVALAVALPCLVVIGDAVGIASGALIARTTFDIGFETYLHETRASLLWSDFLSGLFKSFVFGFLIGIVSCGQGMAVRSGADEVGRRTTAAVVVSIFYIIAADFLVTWAFHGL